MILQNLATPAIEEAIIASFVEEMACFGRGLPQGELHKTPELLWLLTPLPPGFNSVLHTRFASDDKAYIDAKINEMLAYFQVRHVAPGWSVGPSMRPANLATFLESHSFVYQSQTTGMAVDLLAANENIPVNQQLTITEIEDLETLKILRSIEMKGFGASAGGAQVYYDTYANVGFGRGMPWHHYIGWLHGEPVAIASLLFHAGVAGIYGIATIPQARRRGVGAAMTLHTMREARKQGYRIAILSPTEMSIAIYRRIGFKEFCKFLHYSWSAGQKY
jgi:ribosomal protein S18 acetylase RimI-like enzyme